MSTRFCQKALHRWRSIYWTVISQFLVRIVCPWRDDLFNIAQQQESRGPSGENAQVPYCQVGLAACSVPLPCANSIDLALLFGGSANGPWRDIVPNSVSVGLISMCRIAP